MLQTRVGKRTGAAALKMAVDMTKGKRLEDQPRGSRRGGSPPTTSTRCCTRSSPARTSPCSPQGLGRLARRGGGQGVLHRRRAPRRPLGRGEDVILVRSETSPEDVHGMMVAKGILTARGGLVSHAAVVARGWGTPAVVGADAIKIKGNQFQVGDTVVAEGGLLQLASNFADLRLAMWQQRNNGVLDLDRNEPRVFGR